MHRSIFRCAILTVALAASPVAAQQTSPTQPPNQDQTAHSVAPAPPPPRQAESPPPFPAFPYVEPRHRHVQERSASSRSTHRSKRETTKHHVTGSAKPAQRKLSKREKKDERYCASLSQRQLKRNSKCRKLMQEQRKGTAQRPLTKQDKKDERRCASLSLRQVLRDSKCRKVAERQLAAGRDGHSSSKKSRKHQEAKPRKAHNETHHKATKHRAR